MTDEAMLTELQGLLERATAAPWGAIEIAGEWELTTLPLSYETPRLGSEERGRGGDDIELAAALRNAAPRLMELARRGMRRETTLPEVLGYESGLRTAAQIAKDAGSERVTTMILALLPEDAKP